MGGAGRSGTASRRSRGPAVGILRPGDAAAAIGILHAAVRSASGRLVLRIGRLVLLGSGRDGRGGRAAGIGAGGSCRSGGGHPGRGAGAPAGSRPRGGSLALLVLVEGVGVCAARAADDHHGSADQAPGHAGGLRLDRFILIVDRDHRTDDEGAGGRGAGAGGHFRERGLGFHIAGLAVVLHLVPGLVVLRHGVQHVERGVGRQRLAAGSRVRRLVELHRRVLGHVLVLGRGGSHRGRVGVEGRVGILRIRAGVLPSAHVPVLHGGYAALRGRARIAGRIARRAAAGAGLGRGRGHGVVGQALLVLRAAEEGVELGQRHLMEVVAVNPADLAVVVDIVPGDAINLPGAQNHGHGVLVELLDAAAVGRGAEIDAVGGDIAVAGRAVGVIGISARILRRGGIAAGQVVLHFLFGQLAQLAVEHIAGHAVIGGQVPDIAAAVILLAVHIDHGILLEVTGLGVDVGVGAQRHAVVQGDIVAGALRRLLLLLVVLVDEGLRLGSADVAHIGVGHPAGGRGAAQHGLGAVPGNAAHLLLSVDIQQGVHSQRLRHGAVGRGAGAHGRLAGGHGVAHVAGILYRLVVEGNRCGHHGAVLVDLHLLVGVALGALVVARLGHDRVVRRHGLQAGLERALLGGDGLAEVGGVVVVDGQRAGDVGIIAGKADAVGRGHQIVCYGDGLGLRAAADDIAGRHVFGLDGIRSGAELLDDRRAGQVVADAVAVVDLNGRGGGGLGVGEGHLVRRGLAILADLDGLAAGGLEGVAVHHLAVFHHIVGAHGQVYRHGARHYAAALGHVFKGDGGGHGGLLRVGKHHGDGRAAAVHGEGFRVGAGVEVALRRG